jgi:hypothetical protein
MTTKAAERAADIERATQILDNMAEHFRAGGLLLVSATYGSGATDYFRTTAITEWNDAQGVLHLTWAMAKVFGYSLRDRKGYWYLAISGYGWYKPDQLARDLAGYYGLERVRYETI